MIGFAILLGIHWGCEALCHVLNLRFPGSVLGMVVLAIALIRKWVSQEQVESACGVLQKNMILFFLPAGVACIDYLDLMKSKGVEIAVSSVLSTILVIAISSFIYERGQKQ